MVTAQALALALEEVAEEALMRAEAERDLVDEATEKALADVARPLGLRRPKPRS